jgi:hypothetical protein
MDFVGTGKRLSSTDYSNAAHAIGVPVATIQGVVDVEAAGKGFDASKRPKILPEPHLFYKALGAGPARDKAVKLGVAYPKWGTKPYPPTSDENYQRLEVMCSIDETKALESTSWGLTQILGSNHTDAGFATVQDMVTAYKTGEGAQLLAFVHLIQTWGLADELQRRDAKDFAKGYNGPAYAKNGYDTKLQKAWAARDKQQPAPTTNSTPTDHRLPAATLITTPAVAEEDITDPATVKKVQDKLRDLGYYQVGVSDGDKTPQGMTEAAILDFRNRNNLPLKPSIDQQLLDALATAQPKPLDPNRDKITTADVRSNSDSLVAPTLKKTFIQKIAAWIIGIPAFVGTFVTGTLNFLGDATDKLNNVKDFLGDIPLWVWGIVIFGVAALLYLSAHRIDKDQVDMVKKGAVT